MYSINPSRIFVSDRVLRNDDASERLDNFLSAVEKSDYEVVKDTQIPWMVQQPEWKRCEGKVGVRGPVDSPAFFFNTFRFDNRYEERVKVAVDQNPDIDEGLFHRKELWGYRHFNWFNSGQPAYDVKPNPQHICRPCWRLNFSPGCVHRCLYCGLEGRMTVGLNISDYLSELRKVIKATPWQLTFLADDVSDLLMLEPELKIVQDLSEFFACQTEPDRYLILHTKSDNVDFFQDISHNGHTIMCWSLSPNTQSVEMEALSGSTEGRLLAAAKCRQWGMPVRFKFKPFIPVRGWKEQARDMIKKMFELTRPDNISMTVLMWMNFNQLAECINLEELDSNIVESARKYADELGDQTVRTGPFPPDVRCSIYKFLLAEIRKVNRDVPVTISTESLEVWKEMAPLLDNSPGTYVCGCGPCATPGLKSLDQNAWDIAKKGIPETPIRRLSQ